MGMRTMSHVKLPNIPFSALALEPLPGEEPEAPITGKAKFTCNTRSGKDRRGGDDRREKVRFKNDRRQGPRRPEAKKPWENSSI
jgi:hypothetical protein